MGRRSIATRFETGAFAWRTRLADPRLALRARAGRFRLPRAIVRPCRPRLAGARRWRFVLPRFAIARRTRRLVAPAARLRGPEALRASGRAARLTLPSAFAGFVLPGRPVAIRFLPRPVASRRAGGPVPPLPFRFATVGPAGVERAPVYRWFVARLVAIALRLGILLGPRALGPILFLEAIAGILVRTAGAPVAAPPLGLRRALAARLSRRRGRMALQLEVVALRLTRFPQLAPRKPSHRHVGVLALQLDERRLQFLALARPEGGRLVVD